MRQRLLGSMYGIILLPRLPLKTRASISSGSCDAMGGGSALAAAAAAAVVGRWADGGRELRRYLYNAQSRPGAAEAADKRLGPALEAADSSLRAYGGDQEAANYPPSIAASPGCWTGRPAAAATLPLPLHCH